MICSSNLSWPCSKESRFGLRERLVAHNEVEELSCQDKNESLKKKTRSLVWVSSKDHYFWVSMLGL